MATSLQSQRVHSSAIRHFTINLKNCLACLSANFLIRIVQCKDEPCLTRTFDCTHLAYSLPPRCDSLLRTQDIPQGVWLNFPRVGGKGLDQHGTTRDPPGVWLNLPRP